MNKREIEIERAKLAAEAKEVKHLKAIYQKASDDIAKKIKLSNGKINVLLKDFDNLDEQQKSILQSQIYQRGFQQSLKTQIDGFMSSLLAGQYKSVDNYLRECYTTGFVGAMYNITGQGIPIISPIDEKKVVKAMYTDSKISKKLYTKLGEDVDFLKKRIANNLSRGIATADSYTNIARNIANDSNAGFNRAMRIARTEGHRIQASSAFDAMVEAKANGADVVKMWNAALDGKTRPHHRQLDGQIRELEEPFEIGGMKAMYPSDFGRAAEDINCRCALQQRAKWALDEDELETLKKRAEYYGLDKTKDFNDYKKKYLKASTEASTKDATLTNRRRERMAARKATTPETVEQLQKYSDDLLKKHGVDVDVADVDKYIAEGKANIDYLDNLLSEYNSTLKTFAIRKGAVSGEGGATTWVSNTSTGVRILPKQIKNIKAARDELGIGNNKILGTMTHEFAHTLSASYRNIDLEFWKEIKSIKRSYKKELGQIELKKSKYTKADIFISDYADKSVDEFLAEAFAQAKLSDNPSPYAVKVLEVVDKYFKKPLANDGKNSTIKAKLTDTDIKSINDYISSKSYIVNEKLRTKVDLNTEEKEVMKNLDAALDKLPTYKGNLQRSLTFKSDDDVSAFMKDYEIGKTITYKEYLSTTKGETYNPDGQVQIFIEDAKNGKDISSLNAAENEVLYKRGSSFIVKNVVEHDGKKYILLGEYDE